MLITDVYHRRLIEAKKIMQMKHKIFTIKSKVTIRNGLEKTR